MLNIAFILLLGAAALGGVLALGFLRQASASPMAGSVAARTARRNGGLGVVHGTLGAAGFLALLAALRAAGVHQAVGAAGFGRIAAWLVGIALLFGLAILVLARGRRGRVSILLGVHVTLAISGIVVLMGFVVLG